MLHFLKMEKDKGWCTRVESNVSTSVLCSSSLLLLSLCLQVACPIASVSHNFWSGRTWSATVTENMTNYWESLWTLIDKVIPSYLVHFHLFVIFIACLSSILKIEVVYSSFPEAFPSMPVSFQHGGCFECLWSIVAQYKSLPVKQVTDTVYKVNNSSYKKVYSNIMNSMCCVKLISDFFPPCCDYLIIWSVRDAFADGFFLFAYMMLHTN